MIRWPLMLRSTHRSAIAQLDHQHASSKILQAEAHDRHLSMLRDRYQNMVDNEFIRARDEGRAQVHAWAVDVNYNIFMGSHPWQGTQRQRATAALQGAEDYFAPARTTLGESPEDTTQGEITDGTVRQ